MRKENGRCDRGEEEEEEWRGVIVIHSEVRFHQLFPLKLTRGSDLTSCSAFREEVIID